MSLVSIPAIYLTLGVLAALLVVVPKIGWWWRRYDATRSVRLFAVVAMLLGTIILWPIVLWKRFR